MRLKQRYGDQNAGLLKDDQRKELERYVKFEQILKDSIEAQRYNMEYIYGPELKGRF